MATTPNPPTAAENADAVWKKDFAVPGETATRVARELLGEIWRMCKNMTVAWGPAIQRIEAKLDYLVANTNGGQQPAGSNNLPPAQSSKDAKAIRTASDTSGAGS